MKYPPKSVRPLAEIVTGLVSPVCRKRGIAATQLMLAPADLFGERLAGAAEVERILWPRGTHGEDSASTGATLVVRADAACALTLQHIAPQIVERANLLIGWPAIARIRITQVRRMATRARAAAPAARTPIDPAAIARHEASLGDFAHQDLKSALARLAAGIERRGSPSSRKDP